MKARSVAGRARRVVAAGARRAMVALLGAATLAGAAPAPDAGRSPAAPPEHRRPPDQTFLTYPEWFLVFSPAEYAAFVRANDPSRFPFLGHVGQFWQSYRAVWDTTRRDYPFNAGYHVMIVVIGVSTTVEYALRAVYETLVGRLAELSRRHGPTEEDRFGAAVAQDYVDFIRVRPWYEYDFHGKLRRLWHECAAWGPDPIRKWERKYALTTEYGVKALYGWALGKMTKLGYEEPLPVTSVLVDRVPDGLAARLPGLKVIAQRADGVLVTVPRYEAFMTHAVALAHEGVSFREIAGNDGAILVSALVPSGREAPGIAGARLLFRQPILTEPGVERIAVAVPVESLAPTLVALDRPPSRVEHVFDY